MATTDDFVRLQFLTDQPAEARRHLATQLSQLELAPEQTDFSYPAAKVLELGESDPTRDTFAIMHTQAGVDVVVGIGVLHPNALDASAWPEGTPHVILRGFSIALAAQGKGIGTRASSLAIDAARVRYPEAEHFVLTVHERNVAGITAYLRAGLLDVGRSVTRRTGPERVMAIALR